MSARRCTGAILAGGQSSRMGGTAKGLLTVGGERLIDRAATALRGATDALIIVANDPGAPAWIPGVPTVSDARPGLGALSGIHAALRASGTDLLVLAWDAPFVPGQLLRAVRDAGELEGAGMAAPASRSPWGFEPLCCWLSSDAIGPVEALLDANDGRVGALGAQLRLVTVDASSWGDPDDIFFNVNSPTDLDRAAAMAARMTT
jgi:molybdopterin-guanine dinucleotide biosynthesis protein A